MPRVVFTPNLQRHIHSPESIVDGQTVRESLNAVFATNEKLQSYIVDDQKKLRKHMVIFVDGKPVKDRDHLSDPVSSDTEIYVMQALSGG